MANYCVPEKGRVALLTLSAQRDFVCDGSPLKTAGTDRARPALGQLVEAFRAQGAPIFHAVRLYRADGSNVDACRRQAIEEGLRILMPGSLGAELVDEAKPEPDLRLDPDCLLSGRFQTLASNEWAFYRPRWGAFHDTGLEERLRELDITTLVLCGFSFTTATRATVYEASARDFRIVVVPEAVCGASEEAVQELGRIGVYLMSLGGCRHWLADLRGAPVAA
jgi:nicotinamidase-related amidase